MPENRYYKVTRVQEIIVSSAYGEVAAIRAGIAGMDEDMETLNQFTTDKSLVPERYALPFASVRHQAQTVSIRVEIQ